MGRQADQKIPDVLLERYLAGDLDAAHRAEIERACDRSEAVRSRLGELREERALFLAADPPDRFAHRVAVELQSQAADRRPRRWIAWVWAPSAAAAAAALLVTVIVVSTDPDSAVPDTAPPTSAVPVPTPEPASVEARPASPGVDPGSPAALGALSDQTASRPRDNAKRDRSREPSPVVEAPRTSHRKPKPSATARKPAAKPKKMRRRVQTPGAGGGGGSVIGPAVKTPAPVFRSEVGLDAEEAAPASAPSRSSRAAPRDKRTLERRDILAGVQRGRGGLEECVRAARKDGELSPGRLNLVLEWNILPSGEVSRPKVKGPEGVLGTTFVACLVRSMRTWRFPVSSNGAPVRNFPLPVRVE